MIEFHTIAEGTLADPNRTVLRCGACPFQCTVTADDFTKLQDRILLAINSHVIDAHPNHGNEDEETPDTLRRQLAESRAAYADLERMYHRVAREHLVTALRLHKARALIRRLRRQGIKLPAFTVTPTPGNFGVTINPGPGPAAGAATVQLAHNTGEQPAVFLRVDESLPDPGLLQRFLDHGYQLRRRGIL